MAFVDEAEGYNDENGVSVLPRKTAAILRVATALYDGAPGPPDAEARGVRVFKTDDDSFVNLPALELALTR